MHDSIEAYSLSVISMVDKVKLLANTSHDSSNGIVSQVGNVTSLINNSNIAAKHTRTSADIIREISLHMAEGVNRFKINDKTVVSVAGHGGSIDLF